MAILETCCCFRTVRKGSFASAIYTMVYDCIAIIITSVFVHEERNYFFGNATQPRSTTLIEPDTISPTTMVYNILLLIGCCCGLISSFLLIYGLIKDNRVFLIPWILTVLIKTIIDVSHSFYLVILAARRLNPVHIILFTLDFFLLVLTIYAFLCVVSQYQEYKAGRGRAEDDTLRYPVSHLPPPTATSCLSTRKPGTYHETTATEPHSTVVTNDYPASSPFQPLRKPSAVTKHVQFGISEAQKQANGNNLTLWDVGRCLSACLITILKITCRIVFKIFTTSIITIEIDANLTRHRARISRKTRFVTSHVTHDRSDSAVVT